MNCLFPTCSVHPESNGYCLHHQMYSNSVSVKIKKEIPKRSESMKETMKELKKLYPVFLAKHPNCEVKLSPECTKKATCVHHINGRLKDNILNVETFMASCETCNLYVETHSALAKAKGVKKSKFTK
jgi:hypothetical protein